jgi:hypothetical protein
MCGRWQTSFAYLALFVLKAAPGAEGAAAILQGARECGGRLTDLTHEPRHRDPITITLTPSQNLNPNQVAVADSPSPY